MVPEGFQYIGVWSCFLYLVELRVWLCLHKVWTVFPGPELNPYVQLLAVCGGACPCGKDHAPTSTPCNLGTLTTASSTDTCFPVDCPQIVRHP